MSDRLNHRRPRRATLRARARAVRWYDRTFGAVAQQALRADAYALGAEGYLGTAGRLIATIHHRNAVARCATPKG